MKGLFIPDITAEMFRNGCLESIEVLMAEGEIYDIDYSPWIPVSEKMPGHYEVVLACCNDDFVTLASFSCKEDRWECLTNMSSDTHFPENEEVIAWMPLPEPYVPDINIGNKAESEDKE